VDRTIRSKGFTETLGLHQVHGTTRLTGHSINTVSKLLVDIGAACAAYQDEHVRYLDCQRIQADEIWAFCYAKARNVPTCRICAGARLVGGRL